MEYLSTLDASFLEADDADPHVSLAVGALAVVARPRPQLLSYADDLVVGIAADYDAASGVDELAIGIERAVARLARRASKDARSACSG